MRRGSHADARQIVGSHPFRKRGAYLLGGQIEISLRRDGGFIERESEAPSVEQPDRDPVVLRRNSVRRYDVVLANQSPSSALVRRKRSSITGSPASGRARTRDANRPAPTWRARAHPPTFDAGLLTLGCRQIAAEGPEHLDPTRCEAVRGCSEFSTFEESIADAPRKAESSSPSTRAESFR